MLPGLGPLPAIVKRPFVKNDVVTFWKQAWIVEEVSEDSVTIKSATWQLKVDPDFITLL